MARVTATRAKLFEIATILLSALQALYLLLLDAEKKKASLSGVVFYNLNNTLFVWGFFFFNVVFLEQVLSVSATQLSSSFVPMLLNLCLCHCIS